MDELFVDANVFLRFLTNDIPDRAREVERMLQRAGAGELKLHTSVLVVAEIVWVLESYYELPRQAIGEKILAMLNTSGLQVEDDALIVQSTALYMDRNVDFIDAYNAVWMAAHGLTEAVTFDTKHFDRLQGVKPVKPAQVGEQHK